MKRRQFITLLGAAAASRPLAARAQQRKRAFRLGWLSPNAISGPGSAGNEFLQGMREHGYVEGENLVIDFRNTEGHSDRYSLLAAELVALNPDCIVAFGIGAARAAKQATSTIPIVMGTADDDPVRQGLVESYAHPGGNVTGATNISADLAGKRLGLLRDLIPGLSRVAIVWEPPLSGGAAYVQQTEAAATSVGVKIERLPVGTAEDLDSAFRKAAEASAQAVIVPGIGMMNSHQQKIVDLSIAEHLPLMTTNTLFAEAGALISYDGDRRERYRQAAGYVSSILQGTKPADLPIQQPTKFELVINLKTAKALGLTVPQSLLARADEVIE